MSTNFEFNAPQYINFSNMNDSEADEFFDVDLLQKQKTFHQLSPTIISHTQKSEGKNKGVDSQFESKEVKRGNSGLRKVLREIVNQQIQSDSNMELSSKENGSDMLQNFEKLQVSEKITNSSKKPLKETNVFHGLNTRNSNKKSDVVTHLDEKTKQQSKENLLLEDASEAVCVNQVSSSKISCGATKRKASPLGHSKKFISLAEQVEHFFKDTPERYRYRPSKSFGQSPSPWGQKRNYVSKTPNLTTKYRTRKVNFPDQQQREEMELEEIKKHQIKAYPLNEKILKEPSLNLKVPIIKKPVTIPKPFSLTEFKKKDPPPEPVFQFRAQPVPANIFQGPVGIPPKKVVSPTIPNTPQIKVPLRSRVEVRTPDVTSSNGSLNASHKAKVEPFSFDAKMKETFQRKEEFIKKVLAEEKKRFSSFKAQPMPSFITKSEETFKSQKQHHKTIPQPFNLTQPKGNKSFAEEQTDNFKSIPFKARPAAVVHQKPFIPKLDKQDTQLPIDIHLNTEKRAAERQKFDEKLKEKEEKFAMIMKLQKEEEEKEERQKMMEERKKAEFKAKPVPKYKVFKVHGGDLDKLTVPHSPLFSSKAISAKKGNKKMNEEC